MTLRSKLIRLASAQPALRPHLLPLLKTGESLTTLIDEMTVWMEDSIDEGTISKATFEYVGNMIDDAKRGKATAYSLRIEWEGIKDRHAGGSTRSYMWEYEGPDDGSVRDIIEDVAGDLGVEFSISSNGTSSGGRSWLVSLKTNDEENIKDFQVAMDRKGFHGYRRGYRGASTKKAWEDPEGFVDEMTGELDSLYDADEITQQQYKKGLAGRDRIAIAIDAGMSLGEAQREWRVFKMNNHFPYTGGQPGRGPTASGTSTKTAGADSTTKTATDVDSGTTLTDQWLDILTAAAKIAFGRRSVDSVEEIRPGFVYVRISQEISTGDNQADEDVTRDFKFEVDIRGSITITGWKLKKQVKMDMWSASVQMISDAMKKLSESVSYPAYGHEDSPSLEDSMPAEYFTERYQD